MTKSTRSRLTGLDVHLLAALALLSCGLAAPFSLSLAARGEDKTTDDDDDKKKDDAKKAEDDKKDDEKSKAKSEDDEDEEKDADKKPEPEAKAAAAAKPGITAQFTAAFAAWRSGNPAQAAADLATTRADLATEKTAHASTRATLTQRDADLAAAKASLASTEATLATLCAYVGVKPAEVAGKTATEINAALDKRVHALAIEQVKGLGFNPDALPAPSGTEGGETKTKAELHREFNAITDPNARAAYYAKHKDQLFS